MQKSKLKFKIQNFCFLSVIFIFSFFVLSLNAARAANLYFTSSTADAGIGREFRVDLMLNAGNEDINAAEGKIIFSEDLLELEEIYNGDSVINFWVRKPAYKPGEGIVFSGVIPGGFSGVFNYSGEKKPGKLLSLLFLAKNEGTADIKITDIKGLLNDGKGTEIALSTSILSMAISSAAVSVPLKEIKDSDPPESFLPEIASNPALFNGRWFLAFAAQDKISGIDYYEVQETKKREPENSDWIKAESPYVLQDQGLKSYIFVRVVDKTGNVRTVFLPPKYAAWYKNSLVDIIIGLFALIVILLNKRLIRKLKETFRKRELTWR